MKRLFSVCITILMVASMFASCVYAGETVGFPTISGTAPTNAAGAKDTVNKILGAIQFIGYAIAIGMLVFIGIKYIMASANEKADLKSSLVKYVIGAVLIAGGATIAKWIFTAVA